MWSSSDATWGIECMCLFDIPFWILFFNQPCFFPSKSSYFLIIVKKSNFIKLMKYSPSLICDLATTVTCFPKRYHCHQQKLIRWKFHSCLLKRFITLPTSICFNYARWHKSWVFNFSDSEYSFVSVWAWNYYRFYHCFRLFRLVMHCFALLAFCRLKLCCVKLLGWHQICMSRITLLDLSILHSRIIKELWPYTWLLLIWIQKSHLFGKRFLPGPCEMISQFCCHCYFCEVILLE